LAGAGLELAFVGTAPRSFRGVLDDGSRKEGALVRLFFWGEHRREPEPALLVFCLSTDFAWAMASLTSAALVACLRGDDRSAGVVDTGFSEEDGLVDCVWGWARILRCKSRSMVISCRVGGTIC